MMERCYNEASTSYNDYGARGIKVCESWHDVSCFIDELPGDFFDGAEMDRIDNDGNYEPGNIRWATPSVNSDNRRSARNISFNGKTQSLSRWAKELRINEGTLKSRIDDSKWDIEKAFTAPMMTPAESAKQSKRWEGHTAKPKKIPRSLLVKRFNVEGEMLSIKEISEKTGLTVKLLTKRLCERKWPIEKAIQPKG
jgi:hypothetical protein